MVLLHTTLTTKATSTIGVDVATTVVVFSKVKAAGDTTNAINNNVVIMAPNKTSAVTAGHVVRVVTSVICATHPATGINVIPPLTIGWEETTKAFDGLGVGVLI